MLSFLRKLIILLFNLVRSMQMGGGTVNYGGGTFLLNKNALSSCVVRTKYPLGTIFLSVDG